MRVELRLQRPLEPPLDGPRHASDAMRDIGDTRRRPGDGLSSRRQTERRSREQSSSRPSAAACARAPLPHRAVVRCPANERAGRLELRLDRCARHPRRARRRGRVEHVERARLKLRGRSERDVAPARRRFRRRASRPPRDRMQPQRDPPDQRERATGTAHQLAEVVAGDVLHDLASRARHRPVTEHEGHPEHEVARRPEPVAKRPRERRGDAGPDRGVAGRVQREALAGRRAAP